MAMINNDWSQREQDLIKAYNEIIPGLSYWGEYIDEKITEILSSIPISPNAIQIKPKHRIKANDSLIRNAFYRRADVSSRPLLRIIDKVGTRVVVTSLKELRIVHEELLKERSFWTVRESRNLEKKFLNPKEFDYQSVHINLTPTKNVKWFAELSSKQIKLYTCEVQLRTLLQHAFAEVAHDTIYKGPYGHESSLIRLMSQSMALMEVTDNHLERCFKEMENDAIYESGFINGLIDFSKTRLDIGVSYKKDKIDWELTKEFFDVFDVSEVELNDVKKKLIINKEDIEICINKMDSYLKDQPVTLYVFYWIYKNLYKVEEDWFLEDSILHYLLRGLGIGYNP